MSQPPEFGIGGRQEKVSTGCTVVRDVVVLDVVE